MAVSKKSTIFLMKLGEFDYLVCLLFVYSGPGPSPVMGCPYFGILPQAQEVGVFVTSLLPKKLL